VARSLPARSGELTRARQEDEALREEVNKRKSGGRGYFTPSKSMSKTSVAFGGMSAPAPFAP
jgi:hypothetical protein